MMTLESGTVSTPLGTLAWYARGSTLLAAGFADRRAEMMRILERRFGEVTVKPAPKRHDVSIALGAYARGRTSALDTLAVDAGGTPFQARVWRALRSIPAGTTTTYAAIARRVGRPAAVRAVGAANAANPVAIVVPCHRVIGTDGKLHGYAGGIARKQRLLEHERRHSNTRAVSTP
jgi:methylated-DNA-[protein]-cysteine S-methyltransferase